MAGRDVIFTIATLEYPASIAILNTARMLLFYYKLIIVSGSELGQEFGTDSVVN